MKIIIDNPVLVYSPPVNAATQKWGVYAIPKMWRNHTGELVIRFNGEQDLGLTEQQAPNKYFISTDDGETWSGVENGDDIYEGCYFSGINPNFTKLKNGDIIALKHSEDLPPIPESTPYLSEFKDANGSMIFHSFRYGDIPGECRAIELFRQRNGKITFEKINYDFPERIVTVQVMGFDRDNTGQYLPVPPKLQNTIFTTPFFTGLTELQDGTLAAVAHGQNPLVGNRLCEDAYLIISTDGGHTWQKRSTIASDCTRKFGCTGDGGEISLTQSTNGNLICAMRTDMSIDGCSCNTLVCVSTDNGYSWSKPLKAADASVTPHVVALNDGIVVLIYGRPGVHFKISEDNGLTWSSSYPIIGRTLQEELADGNEYHAVKYYDSISYSNTFIDKISGDTILVLYNNQKYDDGDGKRHKAAFVRKITVTK